MPSDDLESTALFFQNQNNHLLAGKFFMFAQNYDRVKLFNPQKNQIYFFFDRH